MRTVNVYDHMIRESIKNGERGHNIARTLSVMCRGCCVAAAWGVAGGEMLGIQRRTDAAGGARARERRG